MVKQYTWVSSSSGEEFLLPKNASMRTIKAHLGITGRRTVLTCPFWHMREYALCGTEYVFSVFTDA